MNQIDKLYTIYRFQNKAYVLTKLKDKKLILTNEMMQVFYLNIGMKLMVVKSITVTMSYSPVDIWKAKLAQRGFFEALKNIDTLEEF